MKMPALFLTFVAMLLHVTPASAEDGAKPVAKDSTTAQKIKELQKERIETLRKLVEQLTKLAVNARAEFSEALEARLQLLQAEADAAETAADRIALYKAAIDSLKQYEELATGRYQAARGTEAAILKIKVRRLELEIRLEQLKSKASKEGKE
jgi:hypothetical protein